MFGILLDDATGSKFSVQALELSASLRKIINDLGKTHSSDFEGTLAEINAITQGNLIIADLMQLSANESGISLKVNDEPSIPLTVARKNTDQFYHFVEKTTPKVRQIQNNEAFELVDKYLKGELALSDVTDEQRIILGKYSGNGGNLVDNLTGQNGSAFEYYTPVPVAAGIWSALSEMGFNGGKVLDPCAGTGIFGATAPLSAAVDCVELDATSGTVNKLINESESFKVTVSNFEKIAANTPDEIYDAVVTNVPFGDNREGNQFDDEKYQKEPLENYFILRSLEKLKPNGLAAFIVPPRCTDGKGGSVEKLRMQASLKAEFLGAYRLPNKVFGAANADTITDVIFFRKYSRTAAEKIAELRESSPQTLSEANVLWGTYLDGKYFTTADGKKHTLGEFKAKDPNKFRDVNRVENAASIPDIAKLMRKLPKSRINWALLDETETMPIVYNEGDTISQDGQILQFKAGEWVVLERPKTATKYVSLEKKFKSAYTAFDAGITYDDLREYSAHLLATSQYIKAPTWMKQLEHSLERFDLSERPEIFTPFLVGLAANQVLDDEGRSSGINFLITYPELSQAMKVNAAMAKRYKVKGLVKTGLDTIGFHYHKKDGFSNLWKGEVSNLDAITPVNGDSSFEGLIYKNKSVWISLEDAKSVYGDSFDPFTSDDWCISADGKNVIRADDYFVGNFAKFCKQIDVEMSEAEDEKIKSKLLQQKSLAYSRIQKIDAGNLSFNLRSPYVTAEEKVEFLRIYVHKSADIEIDENGKERIKFSFKESEVRDNIDLKLYRRLAAYLESGTASLAGADFDGEEAEAIKRLRTIIATTNEQFNGWVRSNNRIIERLNLIGNDPARLQFIQADDESPLNVVGMNPDLSLHGYQNSYVRKMSRSFEGINGFDVGLGKTFTGLAAVQYVQSIGVKKKTLFVVPNSVLSNWHKEAKRAYTSIDDCLFVGLREINGRLVSDSSYYDADLQRVLENNHSKIFLTMEAFERIKLKNETIEDFEYYLRGVDSSFAESENRKEDSKAKNKAKTIVQVLTGKTGSAPYLEDMGVDSIVIDEAHAYKNSAETVDFKGGKYLSVAKSSARGMDAQAKAWYVRGKQSKGDGVMLLTATPITNSPLEVYSMLSLAVGHGRVNDLAIGTNGADSFMGAVCTMVNEEDEGIDGSLRDMQVFKGLENTEMLRRSINQVATIKNAKMVGKSIFVPEANDHPTDVVLTPEIIEQLQKYKLAYRYAAAMAKDKELPDDGEDEYNEVKDKFGEEDDILGHPFNLIRKMTNLIADPDLDNMLSSYVFAEKDRKKVAALVEKWNDKPVKEEWNRLSPNTREADVVGRKEVKNKLTGATSIKFKVNIRAWIDGNKVCINSTNWDTQEKFEALLDASKLDLDVTIPPKLAALLENFKNECANPRGIVKDADGNEVKLPYAKQIIFCDMLGMHNKIRKALVKHAGIPADKIVIITGQRNNDPADLLDIQNGFNAVEDNKYRVIIANEKAEVGINLQIGTQANHHFTIGWTPDGLQQRNGRSARQGNLTDRVMSYFYDAMGTFDTAKRTLVNSKATWIDDLISGQTGNQVEIIGGMSKEYVEALIDSIGDADGVSHLQERIAENEKLMRIEANKSKQVVNLNTIQKENIFLKENKTAVSWVARVMGELLNEVVKRNSYQKRIDAPKATLNVIAKNKELLVDVEAKIETVSKYISDAATFLERGWDSLEPKENGEVYSPVELVEFFLDSAKNGEKSSQYLVSAIKDQRVIYRNIAIQLNENAELVNDWQSQVDMSERIRKNAATAYEEQAEKEGAHVKGLSTEFMDDNGSFISDKLVTRNSFLVHKDGVNAGIFGIGESGLSDGRINGILNGKFSANYPSFLFDTYTIAYPNTALHEQCLAFAAQYEDDLYNAGKWGESSLFSNQCSLVGARRSTDVVVQHSYYDVLQGSIFGIVDVPENVTDEMVVRKHIHEQHKKIIKRFDKNGYWTSNEFQSNYDRSSSDEDNRNEMYMNYAIANNLKMSSADLYGYKSTSFLLKKLNQSDDFEVAKFDELVNSSESVEGLNNALVSYLNGCLYWFNFDINKISSVLPFGMAYSYRERVSKLKAAAETEVVPEPVVTVNTDEAPTVNDDVDQERVKRDLIVRIGGDGTKDNKDRLKELAAEWVRDYPDFEAPFYWYGKGSKWMKTKQVWEIPYGAWSKFKELYPSELSKLKAEIYN